MMEAEKPKTFLMLLKEYEERHKNDPKPPPEEDHTEIMGELVEQHAVTSSHRPSPF